MAPPRMGGAMIGGKPSFTKQQFLQKRPGGSFQNYQSFLRRKRGVAEPKPARPRAMPTYDSLLRGIQIETPAQLEARANRMTNQGIVSQQNIIREEAKLMRDEAQRRMQAMSAAGRAAAQMNAGLMGSVGGEYNAAAQELRNLGSLGGSMGAMTAADVGSQNAALASVGAPGLEATGAMAGPGQAGVETYRGATLPGQGINTAGQAATFGLAGLIGAQNLRATQEAQAAFVGATREADRARVSALKELSMGRPAQAAQFLAQLQEANAAARDSAMSLLAARQTFGIQAAEEGRAKSGEIRAGAESRSALATAAQNRQLAAQEASLKGREIDENRSVALGYYVDLQGRPITTKNGKQIKVKAGVGKTQPTRQDVQKSASYYLEDSYDKRGRLVRTKAQLIKNLRTTFPNMPLSVIQAIANSTWPKGATTGAGGGVPVSPGGK